MKLRVRSVGIGLTAALSLLGAVILHGAYPESWGLDACITAHVREGERAAYLSLISNSGVRWLRERDPQFSFEELRAAGLNVTAFVPVPLGPVNQRGNQLSEDLLVVFETAQFMQKTHGYYVDAWEMVGEPDLGYCRDLPDRVAAYQKAVYLGIKREAHHSGSRRVGLGDRAAEVTPFETEGGDIDPRRSAGRKLGNLPSTGHRSSPTERQAPIVLMGALGNTPGPWLERAARNGLLDYTDAYNFHFYGRSEDFTLAINAHAAFANRWVKLPLQSSSDYHSPSKWRPDFHPKSTVHGLSWITDHSASLLKVQKPRLSSHRAISSSLPLWATEVGENAVDPDDFFNVDRRQWQADFTLSTARQALAHPALAMFMPFVLAWEGKPWAMTTAGAKPLPSWDAYALFTRENPWPERTLSRPPVAPNPVVVQWLPDNRTTTTHKVAGTYRFKGKEPIVGQFWLYNFSEAPVSGVIRGMATESVQVQPRGDWGDVAVWTDGWRVTIPAMGKVAFPVLITARESGYFREYLTAEFIGDDGRVSPVYFGIERRPQADHCTTEPWQIRSLRKGLPRYPMFTDYAVTSRSGSWTGLNGLSVEEVSSADGVISLKVWSNEIQNDPLQPTMAVARVRGLPRQGFVHVKTDRPMGPAARMRVDLLDKAGQRFTIWENLGVDYFGPKDEAWLNLADFHPYSWGKTTTDSQLHPERVEEIQLRFYLNQPGGPFSVTLELRMPKKAEFGITHHSTPDSKIPRGVKSAFPWILHAIARGIDKAAQCTTDVAATADDDA